MTTPSEPSSSIYPAKTYYRGEVARDYDRARTRRRSAQRKWAREYDTLEAMVRRLPAGGTLLDLPCGTCRFAPVFEACGLSWLGADVSEDMLSSIPSSRLESEACRGRIVADAEHTPFRGGAVDYVVSMRFFNLVPHAVAASALRELARVAARGVIVEIRLAREGPLDARLRQARAGLRQLRTTLRKLPRRAPEVLTQLRSGARPQPRRRPRASAGSSEKFQGIEGRWLESDFEALVHASGLRVRSRLEVEPSRLGLQPDRLFLLELAPLS